MKKLQYSIAGVIKTQSVMPLIGTVLTDDAGDTVGVGRYWCPKCSCLVDVDIAGVVIIPYIMPMDASVVSQKPIMTETHNVGAGQEGIAESVFLKTIALLAGKETLDKMI